jgi:hypothetical protein
MLFFVEKIAYKENNLNLYSTPHFFVLIWSRMESMHQPESGEENQKLFHRLLEDFKMFDFYSLSLIFGTYAHMMSQFIR